MAYKVGDIVKIVMGLRFAGEIGEIVNVFDTRQGRTYTVRILFGPNTGRLSHYGYEESLEVLGDEH